MSQDVDIYDTSNYKSDNKLFSTKNIKVIAKFKDELGGKIMSEFVEEEEEERRLGPYSVQSVGAAEAVSLAIGHNPGWVATPTQCTSMLARILPTSE